MIEKFVHSDRSSESRDDVKEQTQHYMNNIDISNIKESLLKIREEQLIN